MTAYLLDWLNILLRWLHFITGIAWIGSSLYFIWLDNHLRPPRESSDEDKGVGGEVWSVHGGGFYHAQKYRVSPVELPSELHWFKWEAYSTWLSGMFLMVLIYWYGAELYLIDPAVADLSKGVAIAIGVGHRHVEQRTFVVSSTLVDAERRDALFVDQPGDAVGQHPGLARPGAGDDEQRALVVQHGFFLVGIQPLEQFDRHTSTLRATYDT